MKLPRLQYITDSVENTERACRSGVKWIQGRIKNKTTTDTKSILREIQKICKNHQCVFVVNDFLEIALEINADGVHLGKNDLSITEAKKIIGDKNFILGGTANTLDEVLNLEKEKVNYIGLGPMRFTSTKEKLSPILGIEGYKNILSQRRDKTIPVFAIGGIIPDDIQHLSDANAYGVAVSGFISNSTDMKNAVTEFESRFQNFYYAG